MVRVTPEMAEISPPALKWLADLQARSLREFTRSDFSHLDDRRLRRYISQIRAGADQGRPCWCNIQVVRLPDHTVVYRLPPADTPSLHDPATAEAFANAWAQSPYSASAPCSAADYDSLRAYPGANVPRELFEAVLRSKLTEFAGSELATHANPASHSASRRRLTWLRIGIGIELTRQTTQTTTATARTPPPPARDPMQLTPEEEAANRRDCERLKDWRPPPISPRNGPLMPPIEWNADVPAPEGGK